MLDKIIPVIRSIRLNKKYDEFIKAYYPNQADYMRRSIEFMAGSEFTRVFHPCGYVSFNDFVVFGTVRYWYGYYLDQQFVVVKNIHGSCFFGDENKTYINEIEKALNIQGFENINYYAVMPKGFNHLEHTRHGRDGRVLTDEPDTLPSKFLNSYCDTLDINTGHFRHFRQAYFKKILFCATFEWDTTNPNLQNQLIEVKWTESK